MAATNSTPAGAEHPELWCIGLSHVGARALTPHEQRWVERGMTRARRRARLWWLVATAVPVVTAAVALGQAEANALALTGMLWLLEAGVAGLLLTLTSGRRIPRMLAALGAIYLLVMASAEAIASEMLGRSMGAGLSDLTTNVAFAMLLLGVVELGVRLANQAGLNKRLRLARLDLTAEQPVDRFEGPGPARAPDPRLERLLAAPLAEADHGHQRLELLRRSGLVVRANGRPVRHWTTAPVVALAPARLHAFRVDLPEGVARDADHRLRRRALSPAERHELLRHASRLIRGVGPAVIGVLAAVTFVVTRTMLDGARADLTSPGAWLWYGLATLSVLFYLGRLRAGRRLRTDADLRWVVTVHEGDQREDTVPRMELLPVSRLVWTEDGRPPGWRAR